MEHKKATLMAYCTKHGLACEGLNKTAIVKLIQKSKASVKAKPKAKSPVKAKAKKAKSPKPKAKSPVKAKKAKSPKPKAKSPMKAKKPAAKKASTRKLTEKDLEKYSEARLLALCKFHKVECDGASKGGMIGLLLLHRVATKEPKLGTVGALRKECRKKEIPKCKGSGYVTKADLLKLLGKSPMPAKGAKRAKKDPNAPKRALSGYLFYTMKNRPAMKKRNPNAPVTVIIQKLAADWKKLSDTEKKPYAAMDAKDKQRYAKEKAAYERVAPSEYALGESLGEFVSLP